MTRVERKYCTAKVHISLSENLAPSMASPQQIFTSNVPLSPHLSKELEKLAPDMASIRDNNRPYQTSAQIQSRRIHNLHWPDAIETHNGLPFQLEEEKEDMDKVIKLLNNCCIGKITPFMNTTGFIFKFNTQASRVTLM